MSILLLGVTVLILVGIAVGNLVLIVSYAREKERQRIGRMTGGW